MMSVSVCTGFGATKVTRFKSTPAFTRCRTIFYGSQVKLEFPVVQWRVVNHAKAKFDALVFDGLTIHAADLV